MSGERLASVQCVLLALSVMVLCGSIALFISVQVVNRELDKFTEGLLTMRATVEAMNDDLLRTLDKMEAPE